MEKQNEKEIHACFLFICSPLLTIGFVARLYFDYTMHYEYGSAPFWLYVAVRFVEFMILAIGCFVAGIIMRKKAKGNDRKEK